MSDPSLLLAFIAAAAVLALTPGVDTALVLRAAIAQGRGAAVLASVGIGLGCLIWGAGVALGLGALLHASEVAYTVVKFVGAAYLVGLGVRLLLGPRTSMGPLTVARETRHAAEAFWRGFLTNLLNPKVGVFYVSFLPQFVPSGANVAGHTFLLASIHVALSLAWFAALVAATAPLNEALRRPSVLKTLDRLTGAVFLAFGVRLAASSAG